MSDRPEKALILEFDSKAASIAPAIHDWCLTHIKSHIHLMHVTTVSYNHLTLPTIHSV